MGKYKVGDELIIVENPDAESKKLQELSQLAIEGDFGKLSLGIRIVKVEYDKPNVILTYRNAQGQENRVFAVCKDVATFNEEMVLEKALLKAFQNELTDISVVKNSGRRLL